MTEDNTPNTGPWYFNAANELIKQFTSPWDWVGAGAGAVLGLAGSSHVLFMDHGTVPYAGAVSGFTVSKALRASFSGGQESRRLKRASKNLRVRIADLTPGQTNELLNEIDADQADWNDKLILDSDFDRRLRNLAERCRQFRSKQPTDVLTKLLPPQ